MNSAPSLLSSPVSPPLRSIAPLHHPEQYPYALSVADRAEDRCRCSVIAAHVKVRTAVCHGNGGHEKTAAGKQEVA